VVGAKTRKEGAVDESMILTPEQVVRNLRHGAREHHASYLAMYSTWIGGIVTDPTLMLVPVDDHIVHRGDGVFEAFKCVRGRIYLLERHLDRLERSAAMIGLAWPMTRSELKQRILETIRAAQVEECLFRLYISRGPGDFSPSPSATSGSQLYLVLTDLSHPPPQKYESGCSLMTSSIPVKPGFFANVKSCNYLPNVLMEKEAEESGVDYAVGVDEAGSLTEGPTENMGLITEGGAFLVPPFERILRGTTVIRMMELAEALVREGRLSEVREAPIARKDVLAAEEVMMFGTTFDVLPVVSFDGQSVGGGRPGPVFRTFLDLMRRDQQEGELSTPIESSS
jgi:branched-chain amino acid aminotransferase